MRLIIIFVLLFFLTIPEVASAHLIGQAPFFKVNGVFTDYYPVPSTSIEEFNLPQDIASENFLVNQKLDFELVESAMPASPEVIEKTNFYWDYGDGSKATGLKNSHTYSKPGTYFMVIKADSGDGFEPQIMQSTAINILPAKAYKLPKAVIEVNGQASKDPLLDILEVDLNKEVVLNASKSESGSSEIIEYRWDLGDETEQNGKVLQYKYKENPYSVFPVLRIKTKDGFIADSFVQIRFSDNPKSSSISPSTNSTLSWVKLGVIILFFALLSLVVFFIIKKKLKNKSKRNNFK